MRSIGAPGDRLRYRRAAALWGDGLRTCPVCNATIDGASGSCPACGAVDPAPSPATQVVPPGAVLTSPPASEVRYLPGALLQGRYRIVGPIGRGGMGEVYRAEDTRLGQTVALKFLPPGLALDAAARERFYAEVRIGRQVSHPNVCRLYDLVEIDGHPCLAMEFVDGEDLATLLRRIGRLPVDKAVDIARDICAGLAAVHDKGVVHRDLKPANIMVDGRGRARLTDFGIAALAEDAAGEGGLVGTLAYLAPEQLDGAPATVQSDLYALGLVLFEAFTGHAVYAPRSVHELRDLQAQTGPPSFTGSVRDAPPGVERMLQQCLLRDPSQRPASALEVLAALPGGDPLQAALAAGETPSPAMVAAAGAIGDLKVSVAWALLLAVLGMFTLAAWLSQRSTVIGIVRPELAPPVLEARAQDVLASLGRERPRFRKGFFDFDTGVLQTSRMDGSAAAAAGANPLLPLRYVLRGSDVPMVARERPKTLFVPSELGRVTLVDPPMDAPGQSRVILDARGRLVEFVAVPSATTPAVVHPADVDWSAPLAATGLDLATLHDSPPQHVAPVDTDSKRAWLGTFPGSTVPVRVEAASLHGQPVFFTLRPPTADSGGTAVLDSPLLRASLWLALLFGLVMLAVVIALARRNVRRGRDDRAGALRLGIFLFFALGIAFQVRADHVPAVDEEISLAINGGAQALFFAALAALYYLAFEPVARRTWPGLLISWTRLLGGRWRDPMVGRDVLLGMAGGAAMLLCVHLSAVVPSGFGHVQQPPLAQVSSTLTGLRHEGYFFLLMTYMAIGFPVFASLDLYLMRALLRWMPLAHLALYAFFVLTFAVAIVYLPPAEPAMLLYTAIWYALFARAGLLAAGAALYTTTMLGCVPLTLDTELWYADRTWLALGAFGSVAIFAFRQALAGKPAIGTAWLGK
jgi:serine/threonine-protein kinase